MALVTGLIELIGIVLQQLGYIGTVFVPVGDGWDVFFDKVDVSKAFWDGPIGAADIDFVGVMLF